MDGKDEIEGFYDRYRKRAEKILQQRDAIRRIDNYTFLVRSQKGQGFHLVNWIKDGWYCSCPFFKKYHHQCKHIIAVRLKYELGYITIEGETIEEKKPKYSRDWSKYNKIKSKEIESFEYILSRLLLKIDEPVQHMGRPRLKLYDRLFCCIDKVYYHRSIRWIKSHLKMLHEKKLISHIPHYNVVSKTLLQPELTPILYRLIDLTALKLSDIEKEFAIDSSGFSCSSFSNYCNFMHNTNQTHDWIKSHISVGTKTKIIAATSVTKSNVHDSTQFETIYSKLEKIYKISRIFADMAYNNRKIIDRICGSGAIPFIPFPKNVRAKTTSSKYYKKAYRFFRDYPREFYNIYHKRSVVESVFGSIKKRFGETIKSKLYTSQVNELLCKIASYNVTVLNFAMDEFNIDIN